MTVLIYDTLLAVLRATLIIACVTPTSAKPLVSPGGTYAFTYEKIVGYGDVVDTIGSQFRDGRFDLRALNNNGDLGVQCYVSDPIRLGRTGLWILSTSNFRELAFEPLNAFLLGDSRLALNDAGTAVLRRYVFASDDRTRLPTLSAITPDGQITDLLQAGDLLGPDNARVIDVSLTPSINAAGDIGTVVYSNASPIRDEWFVGYYTGSIFHPVAEHGDPTPYGGDLLLNIGPLHPAWVNNNRQVCFTGYISGDVATLRWGTFRVTGTTLEKIALSGDPMPNGEMVRRQTAPQGTMNNAGDVAFVAQLEGDSDSGVFVFSDGDINTIYTEGDPSPLGGEFLSISGYRLGAANPNGGILPIINDRGSVLYKVAASNTKGKARAGLFLWRVGRPVEKIVAVGDRVLDGRRVHQVGYYSLNDNDQVAFSVIYKSRIGRMTESIYLATPN